VSYETFTTAALASLTAALGSLISVEALCRFVLDIPLQIPTGWAIALGIAAVPVLLTLIMRMLGSTLLHRSTADLVRESEEI
jgi:hypothetical protein